MAATMRRWSQAADPRYRPAVLLSFEEALDILHTAAYPRAGRSLGMISRSTGMSDGTDTDERRERMRHNLNMILLDLAYMKRQIEKMFPKDKPPAVEAYEALQREESWRCPTCHRFRKPHAEFCEGCGLPKPTP